MKVSKQSKNGFAFFGLVFGLVTMAIVFYFGVILISPKLPPIPFVSASSIDLNTKDDENDLRNRIQIEKIGIEVPFSVGNEQVLELGAWHRHPENGNPEQGGNFVLAAHRFEIGNNPGQTRAKSPFYKIDNLDYGDDIRVFYEGKWYDYKVNKKYEVPPTALYIEEKSNEAKLTLYSCSLSGAAAGRFVIEAIPK